MVRKPRWRTRDIRSLIYPQYGYPWCTRPSTQALLYLVPSKYLCLSSSRAHSSEITFLVRLCIHNINFLSEEFWFIRKKNNKCMGLLHQSWFTSEDHLQLMRSEWAEESNKSYRRSLSHLSSSLPFIFSRSFLLRTAPHYLNAWNRLVWINSSNHSHFWASLANLFSRIFRRHFTMTSISNKIKRNATTARTPISQPSNPPPFPVNETQYYINTMRLDWVYDTTKTYPSNLYDKHKPMTGLTNT